jgi:hypothetical protein
VGRLEAGRDLEGIVLGLGEEQIECERHAGKDGDSAGLFSGVGSRRMELWQEC